jgi:uncharacterized protein YbjT (DUF2867 family)
MPETTHDVGSDDKQQRGLTVAAIGCTGPTTQVYVDEFLRMGLTVRLLARDPDRIAARYPGAHVVPGSMMNPEDVAIAIKAADAAFLVTPIGARADMSVEIDAANATVAAATAAGLPHLMYVSLIGIDRPTGVPLLDAKRHVEQILATSGVAWTSIRCGSCMEDIIDKRIRQRGVFVFPVARARRFNLTCQQDVPRLVAQLLREGHALNRAVELTDPSTYTVADLTRMLRHVAGRRVTLIGKWPLYYLLLLAQPVLSWRRHRMSGIIPLIRYFNRHGYQRNPGDAADIMSSFTVTTVAQHLRRLGEQAGGQPR